MALKHIYKHADHCFDLSKTLYQSVHFFVLLIVLFIIVVNKFDELFNLNYENHLVKWSYESNSDLNQDSQFVICEIDNESYDFLAKSYGSKRISISKIIMELKKFNPNSVFVNFLLYGKGLDIEDIYLTASLAKIQYPIFFRSELTDSGEYFTPLEAITTTDPRFGFLKYHYEKNQTVRRIQVYSNDVNRGSSFDISTQIAMLISNSKASLDLNNSLLKRKNKNYLYEYKMDNNHSVKINYKKKFSDVPSFKAKDLISGSVNISAIQNKNIIIEGTASIYQNQLETPLGTMPESIVIVNAVDTLTSKEEYKTHAESFKLWIMVLSLLFFYCLNVRADFFQSVFITVVGLVIWPMVFLYSYENELILPYGSMLLTPLCPFVYCWLIKYFYLLMQSKKIILKASTDSLTGLNSFRYFCYLLQNKFIKMKKKKKDFVLLGLQILKFPNDKNNFLQKFGQIIQSKANRLDIHGFDSDKNLFYLTYSVKKQNQIDEFYESLEEDLMNLFESYAQQQDFRIYSISVNESKVSSSFALIQIMEFMIKQKRKKSIKRVQYLPSLLTSNFSLGETNMIPKTDMDYISMQISEDRSDLMKMKKRLNQSLHEYMMTQKLTALGELSSYYAHELKNPLHNMLNCMEILEDPKEDEEEKDEVRTMMKNELKRVIDLTKKMSSHFKPSDDQPEELSINEMIQTTAQFFGRQFKKSNISVKLDLDENCPSLYAVPDQIKQVLMNLLLNAVDAIKQNGEIKVISKYLSPVVKIEIHDTGEGIHDVDLEKIFDAFYTTKKKKGTGLGLFVSYSIIQHHGGQIRAKHLEAGGTVFEIILPV